MQSLKNALICMVILSTAINAKTTEKILFSVYVKKAYSAETSEIFQGKDELFCKTEAIPYFPISKKIKEANFMAQADKIKEESKKFPSIKNCARDEALILTQDKIQYGLCITNQEAQKALAMFSKNCGRNL